ncbi:MAG: hypothetical protein WCC65_12005 [Pseudonocardiaceae bacterium]
MTAVAPTIFTIPRLSRRARATLLTVHVATSVGWFGLDGALVALDAAGLSSGNAAIRAGIAAAMAVIAYWVLVPVVFASLVSGLVLALSTPWGLGRYWWVLAKCGIAGALTAAGLMFLVPQLPALASGGAEPAGMQTLIARALALILLLVATGLSVVKPWGKTPRGRALTPAGRRPAKQPGQVPAQRAASEPAPRSEIRREKQIAVPAQQK